MNALRLAVAIVLLASACDCGAPTNDAGSDGDDGGASGDDAGAVNDDDGGGGGDDAGTPGIDGGSVADAGACPLYQERCDGACIPVGTDPDHCGDCDTVCDATQACVGGACVTSCPGTLTICDRACVDTDLDSLHCNGCGNPCDPGEGCVDGACETAIVVGPGPATCPAGGPPVLFPDAGDAQCAGNVAQVAFRWGLCSCDGVQTSQSLRIDGYDSALASYAPGGGGGGLGANGRLTTSAEIEVTGSMWTASSDGISTSAPFLVGQELRAGGSFQSPEEASVGLDAYVDGNVTANPFDVVGALHQPSGATATNVNAGALISEPVSVADPCDCDASQIIPVAEIVGVRASSNDDAAVGLDPDVLVSPTTPQRLDLPCGAYWFSSIGGSQPITIVAHGPVAIYVGGDINTSAPLSFALDPTAALDVFVAGTLSTSQQVKLGSPAYPALARFYFGDDNGLSMSDQLDVGAFLYVAPGRIQTSGAIEAYGGLFAGDFAASSTTLLHYDRAVLSVGRDCPDDGTTITPIDGGVAPMDGGAPAPDGGSVEECATCRDCGNQACVDGTCGGCTESSECCAPLLCIQGTCQVLPG